MQYWTSKSQALIISLFLVITGEVWGSLMIVSVNIIQRISRIVFQNELTKMIETYTVRVVLSNNLVIHIENDPTYSLNYIDRYSLRQ